MATVISTTASRILRRTQSRIPFSTPPMAMPLSAPLAEPEPRIVGVHVAEPQPASPVDRPPAPAPDRLQLIDHPAALHALTVLCNKQSNPYSVRASCNHLLVLMVLEAMRSLPTRPLKVDTLREAWNGVSLAKPVVLLAVTRHGLGLSHNLMDCVPGLLVGSITIDPPAGENQVPQARLHLTSAPGLRDSRVLLFDPVVQSGLSAGAALDLVCQLGATDISLLTFSIAAQGLAHLQARAAGLRVWTTHVDRNWDAKRSPASGLGDFGTRLFA